jgi:hypothetical protein
MFTGYASLERWLELARSGAAMRCVEQGFRLRAPTDPAYEVAFDALLAKHAADERRQLLRLLRRRSKLFRKTQQSRRASFEIRTRDLRFTKPLLYH